MESVDGWTLCTSECSSDRECVVLPLRASFHFSKKKKRTQSAHLPEPLWHSLCPVRAWQLLSRVWRGESTEHHTSRIVKRMRVRGPPASTRARVLPGVCVVWVCVRGRVTGVSVRDSPANKNLFVQNSKVQKVPVREQRG